MALVADLGEVRTAAACHKPMVAAASPSRACFDEVCRSTPRVRNHTAKNCPLPSFLIVQLDRAHGLFVLGAKPATDT